MDLDKLMAFRNNNKGFAQYLGMKIIKIADGYAEGEIEIQDNHLNPFGAVHGGCIFSLIDTIGGTAAMTRGNITTTSSCNINFINPAVNTTRIIAVAKEVKAGRTLLVYDVELFNDDSEILAKAVCTYFRLQKHDF